MAVTDTLKSAATMREAGVPHRQAEGIARAVDDACGNLVTREYLDMRLAMLERGLIVWAVGPRRRRGRSHCRLTGAVRDWCLTPAGPM